MSKRDIMDQVQRANPGSVRVGGCLYAAPDIDPAVILDPTGWFRAIDRNTYDVDCDQDGFFSTSPEGYGRTPLDAIVDLLDEIAARNNPYRGLHDPRGPYDPNVNPG